MTTKQEGRVDLTILDPEDADQCQRCAAKSDGDHGAAELVDVRPGVARQLSRAAHLLEEVTEERDELAHRLHCYRVAAVMLADALELGIPPAEVVAQLRALGTHIDRTVAGVLPHVTTPSVAAQGSESEAGDEGSRSAGASAASSPAPAIARPQRIRDALEAVIGGGV